MPLYKNNNSERVNLAGMLLDPGESKEMTEWLSPLPAGIAVVRDTPMDNPIIYSQKVTGAVTIAVPAGVTRFSIHFGVVAGYPSILFNSNANTPALLLYPGARWNIRCFSRTINDIRISGTGLDVTVTLEKF